MLLTRLRHFTKLAFVGPSGNVLRGMIVLVAGSGAARLITLISIPITTRLYSPEDFGALSVFTALLQILIPLATLQYLMAIPLPRHDQIAFTLLILCSILSIALSILISAIFFIFRNSVFETLSLEVLDVWWWLIGPGMIGASLYQVLTMWATRKKSYPIIAKTQLLQSAMGESMKVALGMAAINPLGLLIGQVVTYSGGLSNLTWSFRKEFLKLALNLRFKHILLVARRYYGFPFYRLPAQFLLVLSTQAPLLLTSMIYGAATTGQLGLAIMAVTLPFALLGQSVSRAYYAEAAELWREKPYAVQKLFKRTTLTLLIISILPSVLLIFLGSVIAKTLLGENWQLAGEFISLLSIALAPQFISASLLRTFDFLEAHGTVFYLYLQNTTLTLIPFLISKYFELSPYRCILIYALMMTFHYSAQYFLIHYQLRKAVQWKNTLQ